MTLSGGGISQAALEAATKAEADSKAEAETKAVKDERVNIAGKLKNIEFQHLRLLNEFEIRRQRIAADLNRLTAAEKATAEKSAADAKVVLLASVDRRLFVCSKSTVCFREIETPSFLVLHTKEASVHPEYYQAGLKS